VSGTCRDLLRHTDIHDYRYKATGNTSLLTEATTIASAAISSLTVDGILTDGCEPNCGSDGSQFKGVFLRNLKYLYEVAPQNAFKSFILANANSIWNDDRNDSYLLGETWAGPYSTATAATQSSALDAIVAAIAVS
jgi:predicted alpha-1,6-mannanase (GH76 family)